MINPRTKLNSERKRSKLKHTMEAVFLTLDSLISFKFSWQILVSQKDCNTKYFIINDIYNLTHTQKTNYSEAPLWLFLSSFHQLYFLVAGYAVVDVRHSTEHPRLPCCGIGIGWLL